MLVLERKEDENLIITTPEGVTLEIHLIAAKRGRAKLGIIAPLEYEIARSELIDAEQDRFRPQAAEGDVIEICCCVSCLMYLRQCEY